MFADYYIFYMLTFKDVDINTMSYSEIVGQYGINTAVGFDVMENREDDNADSD